jgi:hypothetical protein
MPYFPVSGSSRLRLAQVFQDCRLLLFHNGVMAFAAL